jgi:hypothetical protein
MRVLKLNIKRIHCRVYNEKDRSIWSGLLILGWEPLVRFSDDGNV